MGFFKKNAANMITMIRIPCAFGIIFTTPFTPLFYFFLTIGGLSDAIDGMVARKISGDSPLGATLDSISDLCFFGSTVFSVIIKEYSSIGIEAKIMFSLVLVVRLASYLIQLIKFKKLAPLHTIFNKMASIAIFILLFVIPFIGITKATCIASFIGFLGGIEEIIIHFLSKKARANTLSLYTVLKENKN